MEDIVERQLVWPKSAAIPILQAFIGPSGACATPPNDVICTLACEVICCKQLWANDPSGKSDPYVVVSLGGQSRQTETIDDTLDPDWSEHKQVFTFDVHESSQEVHVAVYDSEADTGNVFSDALLGVAAFSSSSSGRLRWAIRRPRAFRGEAHRAETASRYVGLRREAEAVPPGAVS